MQHEKYPPVPQNMQAITTQSNLLSLRVQFLQLQETNTPNNNAVLKQKRCYSTTTTVLVLKFLKPAYVRCHRAGLESIKYIFVHTAQIFVLLLWSYKWVKSSVSFACGQVIPIDVRSPDVRLCSVRVVRFREGTSAPTPSNGNSQQTKKPITCVPFQAFLRAHSNLSQIFFFEGYESYDNISSMPISLFL